MRTPRVTVGLPVYNGERFLRAAIDSILKQDYEDFELLLADNCSTDGTLDICNDAAARDPRVSVHRSDVNRGASWNFNRVVDLARGEYFKWAAHDDLHEPAFLSRCVEVLDADPGVALCYPRAVDIDEDGAVIHRHTLPRYATNTRPSARVASIILDPSPCMEAFGLTRLAQIQQTSKLGAYTGSDRTLFLELALQGRFHEIPEVLFLHRQHEERSVHMYKDARARNAWFDPAWNGRLSAPQWRIFREYVRATLRSPASTTERARTLVPLSQWAIRNHRTLSREAVSFALRKRVVTPAPQPETTGKNS